MSWKDRLRTAAYTSPSGSRFEFDYENVSKRADKKTAGFEFPDADGTYIQDLGHSGRRFPLRVIFWGEDYDVVCDAFDQALLERGVGRLEHPLYGTVDVVPFGSITRRDDLKTAANQGIYEISFWETTGLIYPSSQQDPASGVISALDAYNSAAAVDFEQSTNLATSLELASFKNSYLNLLDNTRSSLQDIADTQDNVRRQFNAVNASINEGIDVLISDPISLAFQTVLLVQAPGRALTNISARLSAYVDLAGAILSGDGAVVAPSNDATNSNLFHANDLYVSSYVTGSIVSAINNQFITRVDALGAAEDILTQLDSVTVWRDDNYQSLGEVDTGESYQQLQKAVAVTAGFLVDISFSLKQEKSVILDRNRSIIDLCAELYGAIDSELDFFISSNNLSGSEIIELPRGREIVYYV